MWAPRWKILYCRWEVWGFLETLEARGLQIFSETMAEPLLLSPCFVSLYLSLFSLLLIRIFNFFQNCQFTIATNTLQLSQWETHISLTKDDGVFQWFTHWRCLSKSDQIWWNRCLWVFSHMSWTVLKWFLYIGNRLQLSRNYSRIINLMF